MLNIIITFLTLTIFYLSSILTIEKSIHEKCLLIGYHDNSDCEILINKKYFPIMPPHIDYKDYSEYNALKRIFNYDGELRPSDSTKIIFWEYAKTKEIKKLPFEYLQTLYLDNITYDSLFSIDSIIKDSILCFSYKNIRHFLKPGETYSDSTMVFKKEHDGKKRCKTHWTIENFGLLYKKNIVDRKSRNEKEN